MPTKRAIPMKQAFSGLPSYPGGKRRLVQMIFAKLSQWVPATVWAQLILVDLFMGGGSVSLFAKAQGFGRIISNDWAHRGQAIGHGLIANTGMRLTEADYLRLMQEMAVGAPGFVEATFGGSVFSERHARFLDTLRANMGQFHDPTKRALCDLLLWHLVLDFVAFGTSVGTSNRPFAEVLDGRSGWWTLNPKRLRDKSFEHLLKPPAEVAARKLAKINRAVFAPVGTVEIHQRNALDLVSEIEGDILYMDPPYPCTLSYEKTNAVLDAVLLGKQPETQPEVSPFTEGTGALAELLVRGSHFPVWIISYGNKVIDLDGLIALVQKAGPSRQVEGWACGYQHFSHVAKNTKNQELLVIAVDESALAKKVK